MQISKIVRGNDFKLQINVVQPQYLNGGTEFEEYNVSQCTDVHVNLYCTKDQTIIPLEWEIKEGTENVIIAKVLGKWLHVGVYSLEITGIDPDGRAWRYKNKSMFSIVDATAQSEMAGDLMKDPLLINAETGLFIPNVGPQGPQGEKGADGNISFEELTPEQKESLRGPQGPQGEKGDKGDKGDTGERGETGPQGVQGEQGPQGVQGEKGDKGDKGDAFTYEDFTPEQLESLRGPQGVQGDKGDTGEQGPQGEKGDKGDKGETGPQGEKGDKGDKGDQGPQGVQGDKGDKGDTGETGPQGVQGDQGPQGDKGDKGDAFTYEDFTPEQLESLRGPQGEIGPQGPQGEPGPAAAGGEPGFIKVTNPSNSSKVGLVSSLSEYYNTYIGKGAVIEGVGYMNLSDYMINASGDYSHAEGYVTRAYEVYSHAEGAFSKASGYASHAEGGNTNASGYYSHAGGNNTTTNNYAETAIGMANNNLGNTTDQFNGDNIHTLFTVGNGNDDDPYNRKLHNALDIRQNGDIYYVDTEKIDGTNVHYYDAPVRKLQDAMVTSTTAGLKIEVVTVLPETPDTNTLYIVK